MYIHVSCVCIVASETYPPPKADGKENCKKKRPPGYNVGCVSLSWLCKFELWENEQDWRMKHVNV